jgi:hypothetical protein
MMKREKFIQMRRFLIATSLTVAAALALLQLASTPAQGQAGGRTKPAAPKGPTPRRPDGKVDFSGVFHAPGYGPGDPRGKTPEGFAHNIARDMDQDAVPMLPWAKELHHKRFVEDVDKDDPEGFCLPMGTPRVNPYPWKLVQTDKLLLILYEGNVHHFRQVFLDGRAHDKSVKETFWGDSIGTWQDNDTLVVDTVGLGFGDGKNNLAWLDADGHPRTNKLHVIEKFTRPDLGHVRVEVTIDDPGAYSKPWTIVQTSQMAPGWEIQETICNENQDEDGQNLDAKHLLSLPAGIGLEDEKENAKEKQQKKKK